MKILLITATYPPSVNGVAISVESLFNNFKNMGHDVYVLVPKNGKKQKNVDGVIRYPSLPNPLIKDYPIPLLPVNPEVIKLLTQTKFDIVHAHHPFYISFFADIVSSFNDIPFVFTHHTRYDEYIKSSLKFLPNRIVTKLSDYTTARVCKNSDGVICPSKVIKDDLEGKNIGGGDLIAIPTGIVGIGRIKINKKKMRKKLGVPTEKKVLLCVSRVSPEKNIKLLLRTLKLLPDNYYLLLVGSGPQEKDLKKFAKKTKISSRIKFVGKVEHVKVAQYFGVSDTFVFPSLTETQGIALLEAAYFNLPCVAVDCKVNREWVVGGASVICDNDPKAFKEAVIRSEKLDKGKVKKRTQAFASQFTARKTAEKTIEFYLKLIKEGGKKDDFRSKLPRRLKKLQRYMDKIIE